MDNRCSDSLIITNLWLIAAFFVTDWKLGAFFAFMGVWYGLMYYSERSNG